MTDRSESSLRLEELRDRLIQSAAESAFSRRVVTARTKLAHVSRRLAHAPEYILDFDDKHVALALLPKEERAKAELRRKVYGSSFPALYSVGDRPDERGAVGSVIARQSAKPLVLVGSEGFKSTVKADCFFRVMPDTWTTISRIVIEPTFDKNLKYNVHICFLIGFGEIFTPFNVSSALDDMIGSYFGGMADVEDVERNQRRPGTEKA